MLRAAPPSRRGTAAEVRRGLRERVGGPGHGALQVNDFVAEHGSASQEPVRRTPSWSLWGSGCVLALILNVHGPASAKLAADDSTVHTVAKGETLSSIASDHQLSLRELLALNPTKDDPNKLRAGERIRVRPAAKQADEANVHRDFLGLYFGPR